ncbi:MAG: tyrosine-protein phosphatase [Methylobacterium sp.]|nr:tyrosine-protein phosphatase [Methylobacterium sp.]MCA3626905.1 tyrosine-protein phosphatase [Methylobacterium sp.]
MMIARDSNDREPGEGDSASLVRNMKVKSAATMPEAKLPETGKYALPPQLRRFEGPLVDWRTRSAAWFDLLVRDFGVVRLLWKNRRQYGPMGWRSNQPMPWDIGWAARHGIRSILNLRHDAPNHGGHALAREKAEALGIAYETLIDVPVFSRTAPPGEHLLAIAERLRRLPRPLLVHCKSGADRAGFIAALDRIVTQGASVRAAKDELSLRHLHIRSSRAGILDAVFEAYLAACPDEARPFLDWVRDDYDAEALMAGFKAKGLADFVDRFVLRHE